MFWTVTLVVAAAIVNSVITYMGVKGVGPLSPKRKLFFWGLNGLGIALVAIIAYRSGQLERAHFLVNAGMPPSDPSGVPMSFQVDGQLRVNYTVTNAGGYAKQQIGTAVASLESDISLASTRTAIEEFDAWLQTNPQAGEEPRAVEKGDVSWGTASSPCLNHPIFG